MIVAMVAHIFFGAHAHASHLVLCIGKDGHVAVEAVNHQKHKTSITDHQHQEHIKNCQSEDCLDIELSFEHTELYDIKSKSDIEIVSNFCHHALQPYQAFVFYPANSVHLTKQNLPPPQREISQTLQNIILLI